MVRKLKVAKSDTFVFILYLYIFRNILNIVIPFFGYADELLAVTGIIYFLLSKHRNMFRKENRIIIAGLLLYVLAGIFSYVFHRFQPFWSITLPDLLLDVKFWIWFYIGYKFTNKSFDQLISKLEPHAKLLICILFTFSVADAGLHIFNEMSDIKMGMRAVGLWDGPAALASSAFTLLAIIISKKGSKWVSPYVIFALAVITMTLRYKSLAVVAAYIVFLLYRANKLKKVKIYHIMILGILAVFIARNQLITYFYTRDVNARSVLWIKSFSLAFQYFPFGAGPGTFASYYSRVLYSPLYSMLKIQNIYGLSRSYTAFVSDTFWPTVIGQFGVLGFVGYAMAIYWLYKRVMKYSRVEPNRFFVGMYLLVYMMITSVAESAFLHWNAVMIAILLGMVVRDRE